MFRLVRTLEESILDDLAGRLLNKGATRHHERLLFDRADHGYEAILLLEYCLLERIQIYIHATTKQL